jgi:CubicO group peptidase (beta-lactamase class C family)
MSSGIQWDENRAWKDPQERRTASRQRGRPVPLCPVEADRGPPDTVWNYNGGGTDLLGNIIERVSGKSLEAFAREALFTPLGISDWEWMKYRNEHIAPAAAFASARATPQRSASSCSTRATGTASRSSRQMDRAIGHAALSGDRLFRRLFFYGQQWWMGRTLSGDKDVKWIAAQGLGGQRIFIVPELDLVVMTTSGLYSSGVRARRRSIFWPTSSFPYVRDNNTR